MEVDHEGEVFCHEAPTFTEFGEEHDPEFFWTLPEVDPSAKTFLKILKRKLCHT